MRTRFTVFAFAALLTSILVVGCGGMNGEYIEPQRGPRGLCSLVVYNGYADDIVIKLYDVKDPTEALHYVYVSSKSEAVIGGIAPGNLMMRYSKGKEWDKSKKMFARERANFETDQVFKFEVTETKTETSDGVRTEKRYTVNSFSLNAGGGEGNVTTSQIDDDEFGDKK
ncbi:MAG TPA: hypothetical protein VK147_11480 [Candidatus Didemnitutus sp.]|nr:hypothetical protein [Candidatus Didemnitutus sp.]